MKPVHPLREFMPYGAPDLLVAQRPQLSRALALSSLLVAAAFLALVQALGLVPTPAPPEPRIPPIIDIIDPNILPEVKSIASAVVQAGVRPFDPASAMPKVVEDAIAETSPAGIDWNEIAGQVQPGVTGEGEGIIVDGAGGGGTTDDPDEPVKYVEVLPVLVIEVKPIYPDIAIQAMVDGQVIVLVLVGRDGRVREARVDAKRSVPMLDAAALEAARKCVFSPALVNGKPVSVWTAIPFQFVLNP